MAFITTEKQLLAYQERLLLQKELLPLASMFSDDEKAEIDSCYTIQLEICNKKITQLTEAVNNAK